MRLAITGAGLITSVGHGLAGSCAAIRAGIARPAELELEVGDGDGEAVAAVGHPVVPYGDGFFQSGAWVRLSAGALEDLARSAVLPESWQGTGISAALPIVDPDRFRWTEEAFPDAPRRILLSPLATLTPGLAAAPVLGCDTLGHVALAASLLRAERALSARQVERCVCLAADSYVDPWTLQWLLESRRLKTPEAPTGLMPGEAGAALALETDATARARKAAPLAWIEAVALGPAPRARAPAQDEDGSDGPAPLPEPAPLGRAIAETVRRVLPAGSTYRGLVVLDHTGETWRAAAWGHAQVLLAREIDFDACPVVVPAESLGEVGAASGAVGLAMALWTFSRKQVETALIVSVSDEGATAAMLVGGRRSP